MSATPSPITLTTDFGSSDHYVAQMKGVLLGIAPGVPIVDVCHAIEPQDVRHAAYLIADLGEIFPAGTIHVAVVDPGVGSSRAILAVSVRDQIYLAPDNGLLTLVLERDPVATIYTVENQSYRRARVSSTFHGRDIFAPAAAHLANGLPVAELGPPLSQPPVRLRDLTPAVVAGRISGAVAWIDRFGNLVTNIPAEQIASIPPGRLRLKLGTHELSGLNRYYAEVAEGEPLLLVGSSGRLEVAIRNGNAAERLGAKAGMRLFVSESD